MVDELTGLSLVVVLAVAAQLIASSLRIPAIVPLLAAGVLAGGVTGLIKPDELLGDVLQPFISIAVGIILFEGSLALRREELGGGVRRVVGLLLTIGVALTWGLIGLAAWLVLDLPPSTSVLIGAILIVSGPTVVVPLLAFIRPSGTVRSVLKWEGILVDPVGAIIAVIAFNALEVSGESVSVQPGEFLITIAIGIACGLAGALLLLPMLATERLAGREKIAATLMAVVAAFAAADALSQDAGLMATIVMGIVLGNQRRVDVARIVEFKETLGSILLGILFVLLAADVDLDGVLDLGLRGLLFLAVIVVVVRPLVVAVSTLRSRLSWRERAFAAVMAPKGIVAASTASVFGLTLTQQNAPAADAVVPTVFLVVAGTVVIYSLLGSLVARALGVAEAAPASLLVIGGDRFAQAFARGLADQGVAVRMWSPRGPDVAAAKDAGLEVLPEPPFGERAAEESLLEEVAYVLVMTDDDALNAVLADRIADVMGPTRVLTLAPAPGATSSRRSGRVTLFDPAATHAELARRVAAGQRVVSVAADDGRPPDGTLALATIEPGAGHDAADVHVMTAERTREPDAGTTILALAPA